MNDPCRRLRSIARRSSTALALCLCASSCVGTIEADITTGLRIEGVAAGRCEEGAALSGTVRVSLTPRGLVGPASVTLTVYDGSADSESFDLQGEAPPYEIELDTTRFADGTGRLEAAAIDASGGEVSSGLDVCIDNGGPDVSVLAPAAGTTVYVEDSPHEILVRATDPSGIASLAVSVDVAGRVIPLECNGTQQAVCILDPTALALDPQDPVPAALALRVSAADTREHVTEVEHALGFRTRFLWQYFAGGAISWSGAPLADGRVAVGTDAGSVHVVDGAGQPVCTWAGVAGGELAEGVTTPLATDAAGTRLFFATVTHLCSIDATTCAQRWCVGGGLYYGSRPAYDEERDVLYLGRYGEVDSPGTLRAHRGSTGEALGSVAIAEDNAGVTGAPTLSADRQTVYIGSSDFKLYAIDVSAPARMAVRWSYQTGGRLETQPLVSGDRVYITGFDSQLHAVDAATGVRSNAFAFLAEAPFLSDVIASVDGSLYAGSLDERLYALDAAGNVSAQFEIGRMLHTSPTVGPDGSVYAARTAPSRLYALSAALEPLWSFEPPTSGTHEFLASPVVVGETLYIGSTDGTLYALDCAPRGGAL